MTLLEVLAPGPLTSVQTAFGRAAWRHLGVPVGGAADPWSARLANRLVGSDEDASLLECTLAGPTLRLDASTVVALTGAAWDATLDGLPLPPNQSRPARRRSVLRVGSGPGARAYVAIRGLRVDAVLGSCATDLRTGFGGHHGRALVAGDRLEITEAGSSTPKRWDGRWPEGPIRVVAGPHGDSFDVRRLVDVPWRVAEAADRTGVRLGARRLTSLDGTGEVASMGLPLGAIQVPPGGEPIVMLADRPVTGGYPVPACVIRADIGRVAQLRPGDDVAFAMCSTDDALAAWRAMETALDDLAPFSLTADDELDWAGSLD